MCYTLDCVSNGRDVGGDREYFYASDSDSYDSYSSFRDAETPIAVVQPGHGRGEEIEPETTSSKGKTSDEEFAERACRALVAQAYAASQSTDRLTPFSQHAAM